jgi:hypothetical protein
MSKRSNKTIDNTNAKDNEKQEQLLEDFLLIEKMKENKKEDRLELSEAKSFYRHLLNSDF